MTKRFLYLPSGYKNRTRTTVEGQSKTGEISKNGLVAHTEHWDGRVKSAAAPGSIRLILGPDGLPRNMVHAEEVARGYFIPGKGPIGVRLRGLLKP